MASPSDLSLDYKPNNYPIIQKPVGEHPNQTQKIQEFLARLEEERLKIEAFKRELPLCLQLLNNGNLSTLISTLISTLTLQAVSFQLFISLLDGLN